MRFSRTLLVTTIATLVACGASQGDVIEGADGGLVDGSPAATSSHPLGASSSNDSVRQATTGVPSSSATSIPVGGSSSVAASGTVPTPDASPGNSSGGVCPDSCMVDSDCGVCPSVSGSINCCDGVTRACFQSASSACPGSGTTGNDAGPTTGGY